MTTTRPKSNRVRRRTGFILPFALAVTAVSAVTAVMLVSYFNSFSRLANRACAQTRCRLAAQSVIEQTKAAINQRFIQDTQTLIRSDPMMVSLFRDWFSSLGNLPATNETNFVEGGLASGSKEIVSPVKTEGCTVYIGVLPTNISSNVLEAVVPLVATAEMTLPDHQRVTATILEQVRFRAGPNEVFNYAYFANNYGWMTSDIQDSFQINGDFRANGDVSLRNSVVNGFVYASKNDTIGRRVNGQPEGVLGNVTLNNLRAWQADYYRNNRRNDMRPTDPPKAGGANWLGGYDAPRGQSITTVSQPSSFGNKGTLAATSSLPLVNAKTDPVEMPMISDLSGYITYAKDRKGTLVCPYYEYTDSANKTHKIAEKTVNGYYNGVGPSEISGLADQGALVLVGTSISPIKIDGPVVVTNDIIISGYISGQGAIYCGRNIHIVGNIIYKNPPTWDSSSVNDSSTMKKKDLVCFIAKGNVVIGNCTDTGFNNKWLSKIESYITPGGAYNTNQHDCDPSDADIGYGTFFGGNYTDIEEGNNPKVKKSTKQNQNKEYYLENNTNRRYYQTACDDALIKRYATSSITHLDGVFYNNHCIMGCVGSSQNSTVINGSLVCRNEAINSSSNGTDPMRFNWDPRLRPGSPAYVDNLPLPRGLQQPHVASWQVVPDSMNPFFSTTSKD